MSCRPSVTIEQLETSAFRVYVGGRVVVLTVETDTAGREKL